jgi:hypothetical protein
MNITQWFKSNGFRCQWVSEPGLEVYVRKGRRLPINGKDTVKTLDIANVNANAPGQGSWTALAARLPDMAKELKIGAVFVENVLEPRFQAWFEREGWLLDKRYVIPCYWRFF